VLAIIICRCPACDDVDEAVEVVAVDVATAARLESLTGALLDACGCPGGGVAEIESVTLVAEQRRAA
jgi:hypothetical protein